MRWKRYSIAMDMTGITRKRAAEILAETFKSDYKYNADSDSYMIKDRRGRIWNLLPSDNIKAEKILNSKIVGANYFYQIKLVTPFFYANDFASMEELTKAWLTTKSTALGTTMFVEIWRQVGFNMVIYLAGLQLIDKSYYEAAAVDGANKRQQLKYITLPRILPSLIINLLLALSQGLKAFDIVFVLTGGGPNGATELINTLVFNQFGKKLYGMSAAYGVILFIITAIAGLLVLRLRDNSDD